MNFGRFVKSHGMSIRIWMFLALLAITLMGVGSVSDAYAGGVVYDPDDPRYDPESSCGASRATKDRLKTLLRVMSILDKTDNLIPTMIMMLGCAECLTNMIMMLGYAGQSDLGDYSRRPH
jgi:hypothetical protein